MVFFNVGVFVVLPLSVSSAVVAVVARAVVGSKLVGLIGSTMVGQNIFFAFVPLLVVVEAIVSFILFFPFPSEVEVIVLFEAFEWFNNTL